MPGKGFLNKINKTGFTKLNTCQFSGSVLEPKLFQDAFIPLRSALIQILSSFVHRSGKATPTVSKTQCSSDHDLTSVKGLVWWRL